jgi:ribosomal-protein-alanine N-acetyltransferase
MEVLTTPHLRIRPLVRADLRALHSLFGDPELMRFITGRPRTPWETRARLKKDLAHHENHGFGLCLAESARTGELVGRCGLEPCSRAGRLEGELAWMVRRPWRGQGLATEAGTALIEYGLTELGLARVFATSDPANVASIRVMERLGMVRVGATGGEVVYEVLPAPDRPLAGTDP